MEIIVCLKQVPDTETQIKINAEANDIVKDDIKWVMNPYDEFGVEEALQLKKKFGGNVTVVSVGPKRATEAIRTALAMGADKGILISDDACDGADAYATAKVLAAALKDVPHDLVFCGQRAVDDDGASVGAALAEFLGMPQLTVITKVEVAEDQASVRVTRPVEGAALVVASKLPALITTQKGLNEPRYASLPGIMKAKKKPLDQKTLADLGIEAVESKVRIRKLTPPPERAAGKIIEGETVEEKSVALAQLLHDEAKVI